MGEKRQWSNCKEIYKSLTWKNNPGKLLLDTKNVNSNTETL